MSSLSAFFASAARDQFATAGTDCLLSMAGHPAQLVRAVLTERSATLTLDDAEQTHAITAHALLPGSLTRAALIGATLTRTDTRTAYLILTANRSPEDASFSCDLTTISTR